MEGVVNRFLVVVIAFALVVPAAWAGGLAGVKKGILGG